MAAGADEQAVIALHRFGLGAKSGSVAAIGKDPRAALMAEIAAPAAALVQEPGLLGSAAALSAAVEDQRQRRAEREAAPRETMAREPGGGRPDAMMQAPAEPQAMLAPAPAPGRGRGMPRVAGEIRRDEGLARFRHGFRQPVGFVERLVMFWSNHFAVSIQKGAPLQATAGAFEREAIRPHVLGRFSDMLLAVERHPAMLIYLDNRGSIGPMSRAGQNRRRGLNENLAREILELHTLGVAGGYSQADVTAFARVLTGWTVAGPDGRLGEPGSFVFNANAHEPGVHSVLGRAYPDAGAGQGAAVLGDLARHPATARFIAGKLARHFHSDTPPSGLAGRLERTFRESGGDLAALARALVEAEEMWHLPFAKLRTPYEFMLAAGRATGMVPTQGPQLFGPLNAMGQQLWAPPGPNGHSDAVEVQASPEGLKTRLDTAAVLGRRLGEGSNPLALAQDLFGSMLSGDTRDAIRRAESRMQGLALLLMSPEFLRR